MNLNKNSYLGGYLKTCGKRAMWNIRRWGVQDRETLLLAMQEELGALTRAHLEQKHEDGSREQIGRELVDLGALTIQFAICLGMEGDEP